MHILFLNFTYSQFRTKEKKITNNCFPLFFLCLGVIILLCVFREWIYYLSVLQVKLAGIIGVFVGHHREGIYSEWYLEFVSIFVESVDEYYVFKRKDPVLVDGREDKYLPRQGCIYTYDSGNALQIRRKSLRKNVDYIVVGKGSSMTLTACKQKCTELANFRCVSVKFFKKSKTCLGFSVSEGDYFSFNPVQWKSPLYIQKCKNV